jgi:hypothetical protein
MAFAIDTQGSKLRAEFRNSQGESFAASTTTLPASPASLIWGNEYDGQIRDRAHRRDHCVFAECGLIELRLGASGTRSYSSAATGTQWAGDQD